jgi:hypothetical protein
VFLGKGSSKTPQKYFCKKSMSKTFPKKIDKNFDVSFSSNFCFIAFSGVSQRWEFKNTTKNVLQKKSCRKVFTKNSTKNPQPTFSRIVFYHVFGRFSMRGVQKHDKKNIKKINLTLDPSPFSYFDPPTHHGGHRFFFGGPLGALTLALPASWPSGFWPIAHGVYSCYRSPLLYYICRHPAGVPRAVHELVSGVCAAFAFFLLCAAHGDHVGPTLETAPRPCT